MRQLVLPILLAASEAGAQAVAPPPPPPWEVEAAQAEAAEAAQARAAEVPPNSVPAAAEPGAWTGNDRWALAHAFYRAVIVDDTLARLGLEPEPGRPLDAFLDEMAFHFGYKGRESPYAPRPRMEAAPLAELAAAELGAGAPGAADPVVRALAGHALVEAGRRKEAWFAREAELPRLEALAAAGDAGAPHPWLIRLLAVDLLTGHGALVDREGRRETLEAAAVAWTAESLLATVRVAGGRGHDDRQLRVRTALQEVGRGQRLGLDGLREVVRRLEAAGADGGPAADLWTLTMVRGERGIDEGWEARGSGWGSTVSDEGWRVFGEKLRRAAADFRAASAAEPTLVEPHVKLITLAMAGHAGGGTQREHFDRAVALEFDHLPAWETLLFALRPRWGGSREALATRRWDTALPGFFVDAMREVGQDAGGWAKLDTPRDRAAVRAYADLRRTPPAPPMTAWERAEAAALALRVGLYAEAREAVAALDAEGASWAADAALRGVGAAEPALARTELTLRGGGLAAAYAAAEAVALRDPRRGAERFEALREAAAGVDGSRGHLAQRALALRVQAAADEARRTGRWSRPVDLLAGDPAAFTLRNTERVEAPGGAGPLRLRSTRGVNYAVQASMVLPFGLSESARLDAGWVSQVAVEAELEAVPGPDGNEVFPGVVIDAWADPTHPTWQLGCVFATPHAGRLLVADGYLDRASSELASLALPAAREPGERVRLRVERRGMQLRVHVDGRPLAGGATLQWDRSRTVGVALLGSSSGGELVVRSLSLEVGPPQ